MPTEFSPEFDESAFAKIFLMKTGRLTLNQLQHLRFIIPQRYNELTSYRKLLDQRPGQIGSAGSDDDRIVRGVLRPAYCSISYV